MKAAHRHTNGPEHDFEPQYGLPEKLPAGEHILWQGRPDTWALARRAFHFRKLAVYFALMVALRGIVAYADGAALGAAVVSALWLLPLAGLGLGLVGLLAWLSAHNTAYTLTDKRVVMRIGIVLTVTFNLPLSRIAAADLARLPGGHGDLSLALAGGHRIGWLQLWPHARPWKLANPQPSLRAVPDAERVAGLLTQAWTAATGRSATAPGQATEAAPDRHEGVPRPALQGH
jgi:hypothetical protein